VPRAALFVISCPNPSPLREQQEESTAEGQQAKGDVLHGGCRASAPHLRGDGRPQPRRSPHRQKPGQLPGRKLGVASQSDEAGPRDSTEGLMQATTATSGLT